MFSVLIVDDEKWSLYGMKRIINWEELGFEICWETSSSIEALEIIQKMEPDVVISDIVMPELTGLEILNCTRQKNIEAEFIFVSGFADFYYAQQAMELGAFYYILKPLKRDKFFEIVTNLKKHLVEKDNLKETTGVETEEELLLMTEKGREVLEKLHIEPRYSGWQVIVFQGNSLKVDKLEDEIDNCIYREIKMGKARKVGIFNCEKDLYEVLEEKLADKNNIVGISSRYEGLDKLPSLYKQAKIAFLNCSINKNQTFQRFRTAQYLDAKKIVTQLIDTIEYSLGSNENVWEEIKVLFVNYRLGVMEANFIYNEIAIYLNGEYADEEIIMDMQFLDYEELVTRFNTVDKMFNYLQEVIIDLNKDNTSIVNNTNFNDLIDYLNRNYNKDLYLDDLADKFFLSSVYVCKLFNRVMGMSFSKYVTQLRIEKAKQLLLEENKYTIAMIAEEVGYNDYFYFIKVFKKYVNVTPTVYRRSKV